MKIFDLSITIDDKTPVFPGAPKLKIENAATIDKNGANELLLTFPTHTATHIDAPFHMIQKGKKLSDFEISHFIGVAIVIDCRNTTEITLTKEELSKIKKDDILFLFTSYSDKFNSPNYFYDYPVISEATAHVLAEKQIRIVGMDFPSPDKSPYNVHKILLQKDILILENLTNLRELVGKRFKCIIAPLKIANADGAPCRVIAMLE